MQSFNIYTYNFSCIYLENSCTIEYQIQYLMLTSSVNFCFVLLTVIYILWRQQFEVQRHYQFTHNNLSFTNNEVILPNATHIFDPTCYLSKHHRSAMFKDVFNKLNINRVPRSKSTAHFFGLITEHKTHPRLFVGTIMINKYLDPKNVLHIEYVNKQIQIKYTFKLFHGFHQWL